MSAERRADTRRPGNSGMNTAKRIRRFRPSQKPGIARVSVEMPADHLVDRTPFAQRRQATASGTQTRSDSSTARG